MNRLNNILKNIYRLPTSMLEEESSFSENIDGHEYLVERINKELKRRKNKGLWDDNANLTPQNPALMYLIKCKSFYKIGWTNNMGYRLSQLKIGNPFELKLVCCSYFDDVVKTEKDLHKLYSDKKARGEWFKLKKNDVFNLKCLFDFAT